MCQEHRETAGLLWATVWRVRWSHSWSCLVNHVGPSVASRQAKTQRTSRARKSWRTEAADEKDLGDALPLWREETPSLANPPGLSYGWQPMINDQVWQGIFLRRRPVKTWKIAENQYVVLQPTGHELNSGNIEFEVPGGLSSRGAFWESSLAITCL